MARRLIIVAALLVALPAPGQVRTSPGDSAISEHTGSIGQDSRSVGEDSRPMTGDPTIGESSGGTASDGRRRYGPVRESATRGMLSGPVSSLSRGPMTQPRTLRAGGSITESSAGAVKHDSDRPLGARISQPLRELGPLQEQLRRLRQHGDAAALAAAAAPMGPAVEPPGEWPAGEPPREADAPLEPAEYNVQSAERDNAAPADQLDADAADAVGRRDGSPVP